MMFKLLLKSNSLMKLQTLSRGWKAQPQSKAQSESKCVIETPCIQVSIKTKTTNLDKENQEDGEDAIDAARKQIPKRV